MLYQKTKTIKEVKLMQLIFIMHLRGVQKINKSRNRKNTITGSIAIVVLVRGLRAQCLIMTGKQREKTGPSSRNLQTLRINITQMGWESMQQKNDNFSIFIHALLK